HAATLRGADRRALVARRNRGSKSVRRRILPCFGFIASAQIPPSSPLSLRPSVRRRDTVSSCQRSLRRIPGWCVASALHLKPPSNLRKFHRTPKRLYEKLTPFFVPPASPRRVKLHVISQQ